MNHSIEVYQVDAFTTTPFYGNPAGVVLHADQLSTGVRQNIARELNCSETIFISARGQNEYTFQYFTPTTEVDLCGHATIAGLHMLHQALQIEGSIQAVTNVGELPMRIDADGSLWMKQAHPQSQKVPEDKQDQIFRALNISKALKDPKLPLALSFTGLWDIVVPLKSRADLMQLQPDLHTLAEISRELGAASVHVYTMDVVEQTSTVHARDFSPAVGVAEDPHTGTANGALAALLVHEGVLQPNRFTFEQGWSVGRPGHIFVEVTENMDVFVGGRAVTVMQAKMALSS